MNTHNEMYELLTCKAFAGMFMMLICGIHLNIDIIFVLQILLFFSPSFKTAKCFLFFFFFHFPWVIIGTDTNIYILLFWIIRALT